MALAYASHSIGETMSTRQLRDYQQTGRNRIDAEWEKGITRTAIVWPTGLGKTDLIADACVDEITAGGKVLVIAHRTELLDQLTRRIAEYSSIPVGRIQAKYKNNEQPIIVATVQTICRPKRQAALDGIGWRPTLVIIDEVQHALACSYMKIVRWAGCFDERLTKLLGVTATLTRGDRREFDCLFQSVADVITYAWAFEQRLLVPPAYKQLNLDRFLDRFRFRHLTPDELMERDCQRIARGWQRKADNQITIAYCTSIARAQCLTKAFENIQVPVAIVIGETPYKEREPIYEKLAHGDIRVMVNVGVATEGFDCPQVSCILLDRAPEQPGTLIQIIGRGLRVLPGKTKCLVLDTTGITQYFDLTTLIDIDPERVHRTKPRGKLRQLLDWITQAYEWGQ
jgi:ATP-dependent helicase IRC3